MAWIGALAALGGSVYGATAQKNAAESAAKQKAKVDAFYAGKNATLTRNVLIIAGIGVGVIVLSIVFKRTRR